MVIVSDTTAISNLIRIHELHLLHKLYSHVLIPEAVFNELMVLETKGFEVRAILSQPWLTVEVITPDSIPQPLYNNEHLDPGELEAIALALEKKADYLIIDELAGRKAAIQFGIEVVGTLGILLAAKKAGFIRNVKEKMDDLRSIGFWISDNLYNKVISFEKQMGSTNSA